MTLRFSFICLMVVAVSSCAAYAVGTSVSDASAAPATGVTLTFGEPAFVNMPLWVYIAFPKEYEILGMNLRYPFTAQPWFAWGHDFEATIDGKPLAQREHGAGIGVMSSGPTGGSCAPASSPSGRLPLHLFCRFDRPGVYKVRYVYHSDAIFDQDPIDLTSEWVELEVRPLAPGQREAWLADKLAKAPKDDVGKMIGDYLPSLLACPDERVLPAFLDGLHHPDELVKRFALSGLRYYSDEVRQKEIPRVIKEKGPTELLAYELSWEKHLFQSQGEQIVDSLIPFLKSNSDLQAGGAVHSLGFMRSYDWSGNPGVLVRMDKAVTDATPHIIALNTYEALWPLVLFLGGDKSDHSRDLLWQLSGQDSVMDQALTCLCSIGDLRDLSRLGPLLVKDPPAGSLAYALRRAYGEQATPYLIKGLSDAPLWAIRVQCAKELALGNHAEAFLFYRNVLSGNGPEKQQVMQDLRDFFKGNQGATEEQLTVFVEKNIRELSH
jgi:hypothetical protein